LAPRPLAEDGFGGMPARAVDVEWEVAADELFTRIVQRGMTTAAPEAAHSVRVLVLIITKVHNKIRMLVGKPAVRNLGGDGDGPR
jgi:hypothetical protein